MHALVRIPKRDERLNGYPRVRGHVPGHVKHITIVLGRTTEGPHV